MNLRKILIIITISLIILIGINIGITNIYNSNIEQNSRTVEYKKIEIDEKIFDDFDSHEVFQSSERINIKAEKYFNLEDFSEFDLVGLNNDIDEVVVLYELDYIEIENTIFLSATIVCEDGISIIDSIPGLVTVNNYGEADIMFYVNDEILWLSDLTDLSVIENSGWFTDFIKVLTNTAVDVVSNAVSQLAGVIKPAVEIATYFAIELIGGDNAAYIGAFILNMKADTEGIYHANFNCWQQYFGYSDFYDTVFDAATSMRSGKFEFDVNNDNKTDYVLWAWKGNYLNLGAGAELGIYKRWLFCDRIWIVDKSDAMKMTLKLEHKTEGTLFDWQPEEKQWWITGFDPKTQNVNRDDLTATFTFEFPNDNLHNCFKNKWEAIDQRFDFSDCKKVKLVL